MESIVLTEPLLPPDETEPLLYDESRYAYELGCLGGSHECEQYFDTDNYPFGIPPNVGTVATQTEPDYSVSLQAVVLFTCFMPCFPLNILCLFI